MFVFITLALDSIGIGLLIPVMPDVIRRFIADEAIVSRTYGYFIALYALMQFLFSPLLGNLSDRFGRRPVLLLSLAGAAIDYLFMALAPTLPLLFLGRVISGISGASFTVASAYIADISDDSNRSRNFGVIGAGFGLGFILGPALGGLLASRGPMVPFFVAAGLNFLNFLFGLLILPESLSPENRRHIDRSAMNPFLALKHVLRAGPVQALIVVYVFLQMAGQTHPSIWTLYTEHRYGWGPSQVGLSLALVGVLSALSQGGLTGFLVKRFGEMPVLTWGVLGEAVCFFFFGYAPNGAVIYVTLAVSSLFWASHPALQSLISRETPPNQQGELQGSLMSLASLASIASPLICTALFSAFSARDGALPYLPGVPYYFGSLMMFFGWIIVQRHGRVVGKPPNP